MSGLVFSQGFSVPKDSSYQNEDFFLSSEDGTICAVCDGATVSFDSASWAKIICDAFVKNPLVDESWLLGPLEEYGKKYDRDNLPWYQQASFDKGSFSSLLGARVENEGTKLHLQSIGDSLAIILDGQKFVSSFPYVAAEEFDQMPFLISSEKSQNEFLNREYLKERTQPIHITEIEEPIILLMTDALGRWVLEGPVDEKLSQLASLDCDQKFSEFVDHERAFGQLKRDDTTLVIMRSS